MVKSFHKITEKKPPQVQIGICFLDQEGSVVPNMSLTSRSSSGVPGTVHGLLSAWRDHGSGNIRIQQLLAPAIKLAEKGFLLSKASSRFI